MARKSPKFKEITNIIGNPNFRIVINYLIIIFSLLLTTFLNWAIIDAVMLAVFIWLILFPKPGKVVAASGLGLLFVTLLLLAIKNKDGAEKFASFGFAVFSLGVLSYFSQIAKKNNK